MRWHCFVVTTTAVNTSEHLTRASALKMARQVEQDRLANVRAVFLLAAPPGRIRVTPVWVYVQEVDDRQPATWPRRPGRITGPSR
jgi:hypothetical protein